MGHTTIRRLLAPLIFFISVLLSAQALAFDVGGLSYSVINATDVEVTGRASGNTATDIVIPATASDGATTYRVTSIGIVAFRNNALASVIIPDSVTNIGAVAFDSNDLTSVIIPDSVTTIGLDAFYNNALTSATFEGDFGNFNLNMFNLNSTLTTITYCEGTTGWPQGFNNGSTTITTTPVDCSTAPDAPTIDSIVSGDGQATVSFTPGANNGSPITGYRYIKDDASSFSSSVLLTTDGNVRQILLDEAGNVYAAGSDTVCDNDGLCIQTGNVWKIAPDGTSTVLLTTDGNVNQIALDAAGNVYAASIEFLCYDDGCIPTGIVVWKIAPDGTSTILEIPDANGFFEGVGQIALDTAGNVYVASSNQVCDNSGGVPQCTYSTNVWKIAADGTPTILLTADGSVGQIALDAAGNVYTASSDTVCDNDGLCIQTGNVWKIAADGTPTILLTTDGSVGQTTLDAAGNVYVASSDQVCDNSGLCIQTSNVWKIAADGTPTIVLTTDGNVRQILLDEAGNVYVASSVSVFDGDGCTSSNIVWKINPNGISAIFENFDCTFFGGGFNIVALDAPGNIYIRMSDTMFKITPDGTSTIFVSFDSNGGAFFNLGRTALDAAGNVYAASNSSVCDDFGLCIQTSNVSQFTPASIATYPANGEISPITITGLSRGTDYLISLIAVNAAGESVASNPVSISIPSTAPDAPTNLTAISGPEQAVILFDAGASNGSAITNYQYSLNGGAYTALTPANAVSPITIPGLTNGTAYSIRLKAMNSVGDSVASASVAVTLPAVTGNNMALASTIEVVSFGTGSIVGVGNFYADETLSITTLTSFSTSAGDAEIASVVTYYGDIAQNIFTSNGTTSQQILSCTGSDIICSYYFIGLASGTSPVFSADICSGLPGSWQTTINFPATVITDNVLAASSSGGPDCLAPDAPDAPQITNIEPGNAQVFISVSVADDGGSPITGYTAACFASDFVAIFGTSITSPITVSGLTNGQAYACLATATNDVGSSPISAFSSPVTPVAPPPGC